MSNLEVGSSAARTIEIDEESINHFVAMSGDKNPIHVDDAYARATIFGRRIAPGLLVASYISATIANDLPGPGSIYLEQNLRFLKPVYIGDQITINILLTDMPRLGRAKLSTRCFNQSSELVIDGDALVKLP